MLKSVRCPSYRRHLPYVYGTTLKRQECVLARSRVCQVDGGCSAHTTAQQANRCALSDPQAAGDRGQCIAH